ncbi:DUF262 domain-containing protein [Roseobacter litoralis]|uniref:GmrSD restriction endonucleases N-terminal domain-containing protein n=1 Tax=Roseobacter litoralis (strain ATCC 49566 / DSM 6996 / JCM 21268 / NBRC 15278 / OCh 149) TaxID=391595 RepID=F7ZF40_ROSLO|nr:DUF262 domain-containing protein [Roseobacter litoralis]AEI93471.1 hypothetical protein DUF262 [Roseobacter litoralis Och 149]
MATDINPVNNDLMAADQIEGDVSEDLNDEDVVYNINTFGADFTVDGLVKRFDRGDIYRPEFQRNFVWTLPQASKFIESILLGLPIPSVFLYREESTQKHLIVDGLQRLTTLHAFFKGRFRHNDKVFRLKDVKKRFEGRTHEELEEEDKRRFEDAVIHAMIIQQTSPDNDNSSVFHIFDRLNSNGTPLQPQEMRAAIYHGSFQELLGTLNMNIIWREIFGGAHKRSKDQELILRFLALLNNRQNYQKPMKAFLNAFMGAHREISLDDKAKFATQFAGTIQRAHAGIGKRAFRPQRAMNVAVYDAVMVAIAECPAASPEDIGQAYIELLGNEEFIRMTSDATSDEGNIKGRIDLAVSTLHAAA